MKKAKVLFLLLPLAVAVAQAKEESKSEEGKSTGRFSVLGLALGEGDQYPAGKQSNIRGLSLSLFGERRNSVRGLAAGLCYSIMEEDMSGIQFALIGSATDKLNGIQFSGIYNYNYTFDGVTVAGLINTAGYDGTSRGLQIAGLLNLDGFAFSGWPEPTLIGGQIALVGNSSGHLKGFQAALLINAAEGACSGLQIGLINFAKELRGLQVGAFNYAEKTSGLQVGVLNFSSKGKGLQIGLLNSFGEEENLRILPIINGRF